MTTSGSSAGPTSTKTATGLPSLVSKSSFSFERRSYKRRGCLRSLMAMRFIFFVCPLKDIINYRRRSPNQEEAPLVCDGREPLRVKAWRLRPDTGGSTTLCASEETVIIPNTSGMET
jgi:hypothetical protein